MEPNAQAVAAYQAALPPDPDVVQKTMFGCPCAFVHRQMFFGTFGESLVARVGPVRAAALVDTPGLRRFAPDGAAVWPDYVQIEPGVDAVMLAALAAEARRWTLSVPPFVKPGRRGARS